MLLSKIIIAERDSNSTQHTGTPNIGGSEGGIAPPPNCSVAPPTPQIKSFKVLVKA